MKASSEFLLCSKFHLLLLCWAGCKHRITDWFKLEGMSRDHLVQPSLAPAGSPRTGCLSSTINQIVFEYLEGQRLHHLLGQPVPMVKVLGVICMHG